MLDKFFKEKVHLTTYPQGWDGEWALLILQSSHTCTP